MENEPVRQKHRRIPATHNYQRVYPSLARWPIRGRKLLKAAAALLILLGRLPAPPTSYPAALVLLIIIIYS